MTFLEAIISSFAKVISFIMALILSIGNTVTPPAKDNAITQIDPDTTLNFIVGGDPQVCNYNPEREASLKLFCEDVYNMSSSVDAFIIAGDIAENGFQEEFDTVTKYLTKRPTDKEDVYNTLPVDNYIMVSGNHDIRLRDYEECTKTFTTFMNNLNVDKMSAQTVDKLQYVYDVNGYKFIVLGSETADFEKATITDAQLQWLNVSLKEYTKNGDPVFVLCHYPLVESHGLPNTWGSADNNPSSGLPEYKVPNDGDTTGSIGDVSEEVYDIISSYKNVFFITGHLHTGFGYYTYQTIDTENNVQGINVPSIGINNKDGTYNNPGTGLYVEVTDDAVTFYARDFANAKYLTEKEFGETIKTYELIK